MPEASKILYLGHIPRIATHNSALAGMSRYAAARGWIVESVNYRLTHERSLSEILAEKRPVGCIVECSNGPPDLPPAAAIGLEIPQDCHVPCHTAPTPGQIEPIMSLALRIAEEERCDAILALQDNFVEPLDRTLVRRYGSSEVAARPCPPFLG